MRFIQGLVAFVSAASIACSTTSPPTPSPDGGADAGAASDAGAAADADADAGATDAGGTGDGGLGPAPDGGPGPIDGGGSGADASASQGIVLEVVDASYATTDGGATGGSFMTGQDASIMLAGVDFNNAGGAGLFNHGGVPASDGTRLAFADRNNNRVLVWNTIPTTNAPANFVLGQPNISDNDPGVGLSQMNWPVSVTMAANKMAVADTYNDRVLIWSTLPSSSGAAADVVLNGTPNGGQKRFEWPWGVWTDGTKFAVTGTAGAKLLLWNSFPTQSEADASITIEGAPMGTPRTITSNGNFLAVGDHNPVLSPPVNGQGNHVWTTWPTSNNQAPNFFLQAPFDPDYAWLQGAVTDAGQLVMLGRHVFIWNTLPKDAGAAVSLTLSNFNFEGGDGSGLTMAGDRMVVGMANGNRMVVYNTIPADASAQPDYAIGSSSTTTNTLLTEYFITNPVPETDGTSLWVISDFDRMLSVWTKVPNQSGARPNFRYQLPFAPWASALAGGRYVIAGGKTILSWSTAPRNGEMPDVRFDDSIGNVVFQEIRGVSWDGTYFAVADYLANKIYVWSGFPSKTSNVWVTLSISAPVRMNSNGTYLAVALQNLNTVGLYTLSGLTDSSMPQYVGGSINLPQAALIHGNRLFVADTNWARVKVWNSVATALADAGPDAILGEQNATDVKQEIGRAKLFWPASLAFDGRHLWVGEYKFSGRLVRFTTQP